jgi:dethiobiotin synthetase
VLGSGTGVGKTYFTVALARALARDRHATVLAVKPVETGFHVGRRRAEPSDADRLGRASAGGASVTEPLYGFRDPISPHLAARREKRLISVPRITAWIRGAEKSHTLRDATLHWTLVETAGGALSPLTSKASNVDLATALGPATWILVAPDALGVLHDVRATLLALQQRARAPDFVVLSAARAKDASTGTNAAELSRLGIAEPIATLPRDKNPARALAPLVRALQGRAAKGR